MKEISPDILILLKKHAKGELDDSERGDLDALLLKHPELQEELEFTRALVRATEQAERKRLLAMIERVEGQADAPGLFQTFKRRMLAGWERMAGAFSPPTRHRKLVWATVVVLLLAAAVGVWWSNWQVDALGEFQRMAYIPADVPGSLRRGTDDKPFSQAVTEYESGNYRQSLALLQNVSTADSLYLFSLYLQGHNNYKLGNYEQALESFDAIGSQQNVPTTFNILTNPDNMAWTRVLVLLSQYRLNKEKSKKIELEQALQQFLATANSGDTTYYNKAIELQNLLGSRQ